MYGACPNANETCRYAPDCYSDEHHAYWPKRRYKSQVEKEFRNLPENREMMCRAEHDELHATERPPLKPSRQEMLQAIAAQMIEEVA